MAQLSGKAANTVLAEIRGPQINRNYAENARCVAVVQVFGSGGVKVQQNTTPIIRSFESSPNPQGFTIAPDPSGWSDVGSEIDAEDGYTEVALTATTAPRWIRWIVSTAGTGKAFVGGDWDKITGIAPAP